MFGVCGVLLLDLFIEVLLVLVVCVLVFENDVVWFVLFYVVEYDLLVGVLVCLLLLLVGIDELVGFVLCIDV